MSTYMMGIDPGKSGGIALIPLDDRDDLPIATSMSRLTEREITDWICSENVTRCYLESVHSMPGQGVKSMFTFGQSYGFIRGVLIARHIPFETVTPLKWQTALRCRSKGDKNITKARAQELFPMIDKITHATADSLLIAEYGIRKEAGIL
tara:strand:+ start:722 stop:1171 length:450 start_codon:yes stop_codon:yes gene_type:complete